MCAWITHGLHGRSALNVLSTHILLFMIVCVCGACFARTLHNTTVHYNSAIQCSNAVETPHDRDSIRQDIYNLLCSIIDVSMVVGCFLLRIIKDVF